MNEVLSIAEASEELDRTLGTETRQAYARVLEVAPHLGVVAVVLGGTYPAFCPSKDGLENSQVEITPERRFYESELASPHFPARFRPFQEFFVARGIVPAVKELVVVAMLHELGHADDYHTYITHANGDTAAAFKTYDHDWRNQVEALPLGGPTSAAEAAWDENIDGYQDQMREAGFTNEAWLAILEANTIAYTQLPQEKIPDNFALQILASIYT
ncbi:MAG: hypothetical protein JWS12_13 [Candidatus Saccharibacteria bacterium]|nr:hypothetical protein [Candidatus Saccharibacteria bacterium]